MASESEEEQVDEDKSSLQQELEDVQNEKYRLEDEKNELMGKMGDLQNELEDKKMEIERKDVDTRWVRERLQEATHAKEELVKENAELKDKVEEVWMMLASEQLAFKRHRQDLEKASESPEKTSGKSKELIRDLQHECMHLQATVKELQDENEQMRKLPNTREWLLVLRKAKEMRAKCERLTKQLGNWGEEAMPDGLPLRASCLRKNARLRHRNEELRSRCRISRIHYKSRDAGTQCEPEEEAAPGEVSSPDWSYVTEVSQQIAFKCTKLHHEVFETKEALAEAEKKADDLSALHLESEGTVSRLKVEITTKDSQIKKLEEELQQKKVEEQKQKQKPKRQSTRPTEEGELPMPMKMERQPSEGKKAGKRLTVRGEDIGSQSVSRKHHPRKTALQQVDEDGQSGSDDGDDKNSLKPTVGKRTKHLSSQEFGEPPEKESKKQVLSSKAATKELEHATKKLKDEEEKTKRLGEEKKQLQDDIEQVKKQLVDSIQFDGQACCVYCGTRWEKEAKFCRECGNKRNPELTGEETSATDDVTSNTIVSFSRKLAKDVSKGNEEIKHAIMKFMEESAKSPSLDPMTSDFSHFDIKHEDKPMRVFVSLSVKRKSDGGFQVKHRTAAGVLPPDSDPKATTAPLQYLMSKSRMDILTFLLMMEPFLHWKNSILSKPVMERELNEAHPWRARKHTKEMFVAACLLIQTHTRAAREKWEIERQERDFEDNVKQLPTAKRQKEKEEFENKKRILEKMYGYEATARRRKIDEMIAQYREQIQAIQDRRRRLESLEEASMESDSVMERRTSLSSADQAQNLKEYSAGLRNEYGQTKSSKHGHASPSIGPAVCRICDGDAVLCLNCGTRLTTAKAASAGLPAQGLPEADAAAGTSGRQQERSRKLQEESGVALLLGECKRIWKAEKQARVSATEFNEMMGKVEELRATSERLQTQLTYLRAAEQEARSLADERAALFRQVQEIKQENQQLRIQLDSRQSEANAQRDTSLSVRRAEELNHEGALLRATASPTKAGAGAQHSKLGLDDLKLESSLQRSDGHQPWRVQWHPPEGALSQDKNLGDLGRLEGLGSSELLDHFTSLQRDLDAIYSRALKG